MGVVQLLLWIAVAAGINPYRYSPAQVEAARANASTKEELHKLNPLLHRSPEISKVFTLKDHRSVPTIYPPLSEAVFAATMFVTPERAPVAARVQLRADLLSAVLVR